jgi:hypothetical protein
MTLGEVDHPSLWKRSDSRLYLGMAIGTQEDALCSLGSHLLDRPREASPRQAEFLLARIDVMEVERSAAAVVSADLAAPAGFSYEQQLRAATPVHHALHAAPLAAVVAPALQHELRAPVCAAHLLYELR